MTEIPRDKFKHEVVRRLDRFAAPHRLGHQAAYANRYYPRSDHDAPVEIMFEKDPDTEPHLWVLAAQVESLRDGPIPSAFYSKDDLYKEPARNGGKQYGRHSALEKMTWLGRADLVRFTLRDFTDLDHILAVLKQANRKGPTGT